MTLHRPGLSSGFTLMEVLLATLLLATGMVVAFAAVRSASAIGSRGEQIARANEQMRAVQGLLRRQLGSAVTLPFVDGDVDHAEGAAPVRFEGAPDRMRFVADLPAYLGRGGPYLHELKVREEGGRAQLVVGLTLLQAGVLLPEQPARAPELLVDDVKSVVFRYRGVDYPSGELQGWVPQWAASERLPLLVSIEITPQHGAAWPPLVVALPQMAMAGTP